MDGSHKPSLALLGAIALLVAEPAGAQVAYVTDAQLDVVSAVDATTATVTATIPVGPGIRPCGIALSPDGETAYIANPSLDTVSVVDLPSMTTSSIPLTCPPGGCSPKGVIVSPDGALVYAIGENFVSLSINEIDARTQAVSRRFELGSNGVSGGCNVGTITPDGRLLYVRVVASQLELAVLDTMTGTEIARLEDGPFYSAVALPNGTDVLAGGAARIAVIDTATQEVARVIPIDGNPGKIVTSPDGSRGGRRAAQSERRRDPRRLADERCGRARW